MKLTVRTVSYDDPRPLLDVVPDDVEVSAWLTGGEGLVAWGVAARLNPGDEPDTSPGTDLGDVASTNRNADTDRFDRAESWLATLAADAEVIDEVDVAGTGLVAFGSFTFTATPGSVFLVPRVVVGRRDGVGWLTTIDPAGSQPCPGPRTDPVPTPRRDRPRYAGASNPDVAWLEAVAEAIRRIDEGAFEKVVLARDHALWSREVFDPVDLARRLTARFAGCHTFVVDGLVGATPELLVGRHGSRVRSRVLAGTAARGSGPDEDARLGRELLASRKDRWEHELAVASVLEALDDHCVELTHDTEPWLLRLDNVQHLATDVLGTTHDHASSLAVAAALHPTAAVGGTPRNEALRAIAELEGMDRQRYAAPVGWTEVSGDGEWGIALRCAQLEGARARLFAGVGVVAGSLPENELAETRLKLLAMQDVLDARPG